MPKIGIIEQHKLQDRIIGLSVAEGKKDYQIADILTAEGYSISQPTVSRFLKKHRERTESKSQQIFEDHVEKELPKDLDAIEEMEKQCLEWSREEVAQKAERISNWRRVSDALPGIINSLITAGPDEKERQAVAKGFVRQCIGWVLEDRKDQKLRLSAMRMGGYLIEVKLRHAGVIDAADAGNIYIRPDPDNKPSKKDEEKGGRLYVVGKKDNAE